MEGTQKFVCATNGSVKNLFKKDEGLFLSIEETLVSGKGHICNADGENGYIGEFSFSMDDVVNIMEENYKLLPGVVLIANKRGLYGKTKLKIYFPQLKHADEAISLIKTIKKMEDAPETKKDTEVEEKVEETKPNTEASVNETKAEKAETVEDKEEVKGDSVVTPVPEKEIPNVEVDVDNSPVEETQIKQTSVAIAVDASFSGENISEEEYQKRMDKLDALKECGLLEEKEYNAKRMELASGYFNLGDLNERIQKLIALRDCGLLSEAEFDKSREDIVNECGDIDVEDVNQYRENIQKILFLEMGGFITEAECERTKQMLIKDATFKVTDSNEVFARKLRRLPALKEAGLIDSKTFDRKVESMYAVLDVSEDDTKENTINKLLKWPLLAQENYVTASELKSKQNEIVDDYLNATWKTPEELKSVINKMIILKEGGCLGEWEFNKRREQLLSDVDNVEDYTTRLTMYKMLPEVGFVGEEEFADIKQKCIDKIFVDSSSVAEFKVRANNLMELQKVGILSSDEFAKYKSKLMSEL